MLKAFKVEWDIPWDDKMELVGYTTEETNIPVMIKRILRQRFEGVGIVLKKDKFGDYDATIKFPKSNETSKETFQISTLNIEDMVLEDEEIPEGVDNLAQA